MLLNVHHFFLILFLQKNLNMNEEPEAGNADDVNVDHEEATNEISERWRSSLLNLNYWKF